MIYYALVYSGPPNHPTVKKEEMLVFDAPDLLAASYGSAYRELVDESYDEHWLEYIDELQIYETSTGLGWADSSVSFNFIDVYAVSESEEEVLQIFQVGVTKMIDEARNGYIDSGFEFALQSALKKFQSPNWVSVKLGTALPRSSAAIRFIIDPLLLTTQFFGMFLYVDLLSDLDFYTIKFLAPDLEEASAAFEMSPANVDIPYGSMEGILDPSKNYFDKYFQKVLDGQVYSTGTGMGWFSDQFAKAIATTSAEAEKAFMEVLENKYGSTSWQWLDDARKQGRISGDW